MDALELLLSRDSALKLESPGPTNEELDQIFASANRAPDHGRLRPWRFLVIPTEKRARMGDLMADAMKRREPTATAEALQREKEKPLRAPVIVVASARIQKGHRIPEVEQFAAASAAVQSIMLAAPALGFGAMWKTGDPAYDPWFKEAIGLPAEDDIIGFIYLGTRAGGVSPAPRPAPRDHVAVWQG